jgi:hypothetical protein
MNKEERTRDRDNVERWARAERVDFENEAERAKAKLMNVDRREQQITDRMGSRAVFLLSTARNRYLRDPKYGCIIY